LIDKIHKPIMTLKLLVTTEIEVMNIQISSICSEKGFAIVSLYESPEIDAFSHYTRLFIP
jgi:hypothetical protein